MMMKDYVWSKLKYFKPDEFPAPDKMDHSLLLAIDRLRSDYGSPLRVSASYASSGHAKDSQHYLGKAVDLIPAQLKSKEELIDLYLIAEKMNFGGIGLYGWGFPGTWNHPGIHVDIGPVGRRWAVNDQESKYVALNGSYLKRLLA